jgi:hypothetical protein
MAGILQRLASLIRLALGMHGRREMDWDAATTAVTCMATFPFRPIDGLRIATSERFLRVEAVERVSGGESARLIRQTLGRSGSN